MTCEHCVQAVTGELTGPGRGQRRDRRPVPGGLSAVTVTSAAPLSEQQVTAALDEAGDYELAGN